MNLQSPSRRNAPVLAAATAGLVASIPMLVVMDLLNRMLPGESEESRLPPMKVTTRLAEEVDVVDRMPPVAENVLGFIAHLGFGGGMGTLYGGVSPHVSLPPAMKGMGFGLLVWICSYAGWLPALGILPSPHHRTVRRNVVIILSHLVWGMLLGLLTDRLTKENRRP